MNKRIIGKTTHGLSRHPLYRVLAKIKDRVYNKNHEAYHRYGGAGVTICKEWLHKPEAFIKWALSNGWQKGLQIDKDIIPKKLGIPALLYSPELCSVVTPKENSNSKSDNVVLEYNGRSQTLMQWSEELKIDQATLHHRLFDYKYTIEEAFTLPRTGRRNCRMIEYKGELRKVNEWCKLLGLNRNTILNRIDKFGMTADEAFDLPKNNWATRKYKKQRNAFFVSTQI